MLKICEATFQHLNWSIGITKMIEILKNVKTLKW